MDAPAMRIMSISVIVLIVLLVNIAVTHDLMSASAQLQIVFVRMPSYGRIVYGPYRLHTEGRWIKDSFGNNVRLKGAAVFWRWQFTEAWENFDPLNYIDETPEKYDVYRDSGANFLRIQLNKWLWDNAYDVYTRAVDTLIEWCKQRGIMVVLTFHGWHDNREGYYRDWTKEEQVDYMVNGSMQVFITTLADRYKTENTVIGFEIMPERPDDVFWAKYRGISREEARTEYRQAMVSVIRAVHSIDSGYLIFVYPHNDDCLRQFIEESPIDEPNVVFSIMKSVSWDRGYWAYADAYYEGKMSEGLTLMEESYRSWLFDVLELGYPAILMETEASMYLPNATAYVDDLFTLFEKYEASICWWAFDRQKTRDYGCEWLFLLQDTKDPKPILSEIGLVWTEHMK